VNVFKDHVAFAAALETHPDYRVLRRLALPDVEGSGLEGAHHGSVLDVETTGLDVEQNDVVELVVHPFMFRAPREGEEGNAAFVRFFDPVRMLNEPRAPIPPEMTAIHGLTDADVAGHRIEEADLAAVGDSSVIIAHHAAYDRPFCEKLSPIFKAARWACSMNQVPWKANGFTSNSLENICTRLGVFYDAHRATNDCAAVLYALGAMVGGKTGLQHLIEATRRRFWHVFAVEAPFDSKERLKARGYQWSDGSAGLPKAWHKEIAHADRAAEESWLSAHVYNYQTEPPWQFREVTAKERFTSRG